MTDPFAPKENEPVSLTQGTYASWYVVSDFSSALYSLKYVFLQGDASVGLVGTYDGARWVFVADSTFTAGLSAGRHRLDQVVVRVSDSEEIVCRSSTIICFAENADRASHAQLMVDKIESILLNRADQDVESYSIGSRSISKMSVEELTHWREYYLAELGREADPITGKRPRTNTLKVGFV